MQAPPLVAPALRRFGLVLAGMVAAVFGLLLPWLGGRPMPEWPWWAAAALVTVSVAAPTLLGPVHRAWMTLGAALARLNTRILLVVVYLVLIVPVGAVMRLVGYDPMRRRMDGAESYRAASVEHDARDMEKPY